MLYIKMTGKKTGGRRNKNMTLLLHVILLSVLAFEFQAPDSSVVSFVVSIFVI